MNVADMVEEHTAATQADMEARSASHDTLRGRQVRFYKIRVFLYRSTERRIMILIMLCLLLIRHSILFRKIEFFRCATTMRPV